MEKCACFYFDLDEEVTKETDGIVQVCYCGHNDDEHDDDGECQAEVEIA